MQFYGYGVIQSYFRTAHRYLLFFWLDLQPWYKNTGYRKATLPSTPPTQSSSSRTILERVVQPMTGYPTFPASSGTSGSERGPGFVTSRIFDSTLPAALLPPTPMDTLVIGLLSGFFLFLALVLLILCLRRLLNSPLTTGIQKLCKLVWKQSERSAAHQERQVALITRCSTLLEQQLAVNRNFQEQQIAHNSAFRTLQGQQIALSTANRTLQEQQLASITENNALLKEQIARITKVISFQRQQLRRYHSLRMANKRAVYTKSNSLRQKELSETRQFKKAILAISKLLATSLTSQAAPTGAVLRTSSGSSENPSDSVPGSPLGPSSDVLEALSTISSRNIQTAELTVTSRHNEQENTENLPSDCSTVRPVLRKVQASTTLVELSVKEQPFEEENTQPEEGFVRARAALFENAAATGSNIRTEL